MIKKYLQYVERKDNIQRNAGWKRLDACEWTEEMSDELFQEFLQTLSPEDFSRYPNTEELKKRLAEYHHVYPSNLMLGAGSDYCLRCIFDCFDENSTVITTDPCFPMYDVYAKLNNHHLVKTDEKYLTTSTLPCDLFVFSNPCNPTGEYLGKDAIETILKNNPKAWVVVDEAYIYYTHNFYPIISLLDKYSNLIITRSFSKVFGAAGCRIGFVIAHPAVIDTISKFRSMYEISGPSVKYAQFILNHKHRVYVYCELTQLERASLVSFMKEKNIKVISSEGNWIHIEQTPEIEKYLDDNKIIVKKDTRLPGHSNHWIRLTVGPGVKELFKDLNIREQVEIV